MADHELTQAQLAKVLSSEGRVAAATLSSWESTTNPKTPSAAASVPMLDSFVRSDRWRANPTSYRKINLQTPSWTISRARVRLLALFHPENRNVRRSFQFDAGQ